MAFLASSSNARLDLSNGGCVLIASCTKRDQTVRESRLDLNKRIPNWFGEFGEYGSHFALSAKNIRLEGDNLVCDLHTGSGSSYQERKLDLNARIANLDGQLVWIRTIELPNVRASNADNLQHLWATIDTSAAVVTSAADVVLSGTFVTNEGQKFPQTPFKLDSNTYVFGGKEHQYFKMRAVDTNGNLSRSKYVLHTQLDNLSNLTADLWNAASDAMRDASVDYNVIDVDVAAQVAAYTAKVRITRPLSIGTTGGTDGNGIHHMHINTVEAYDQAGAKLKLHYNGNASKQVKESGWGPDRAIDGDGTTSNVDTFSHNKWGSQNYGGEGSEAPYGVEDHWMEFDVSGGQPARIFVRNNHVSERLAGATLAVLTVGGAVHEEFTLSESRLQEHVLSDPASLPAGVSASLELTWHDQGWGYRKGHIHARKDGGAWEGISTDAAEHEATRESFEIPAKFLGGKLELGYSVGSDGGHTLIVKEASVTILN